MTENSKLENLRSAGMVVGFLIGITGPILAFGQKKHSTEFIMNIDIALPWAAGLGLAGALIVLWACWGLPRRATGGPALAIIMLVVSGSGLVVTLVRSDWTQSGAIHQISVLGQVAASVVLLISAIQCARKPVHLVT